MYYFDADLPCLAWEFKCIENRSLDIWLIAFCDFLDKLGLGITIIIIIIIIWR